MCHEYVPLYSRENFDYFKHETNGKKNEFKAQTCIIVVFRIFVDDKSDFCFVVFWANVVATHHKLMSPLC